MMLKTENLNKHFREGAGSVRAVREVNLEIAEGERVYIHGPSGAGKSTLIQMLGGLMRPTSGTVTFKGKNIYRMFDGARSALRGEGFGFIFQFYHLLPELNVLENVMLPARILRKGSSGEIRKRSLELLERVMLEHRIKHTPARLSGGEAQRVAIARALVNSPAALFCDEPTGNLDSAMSEEIFKLLYEISVEKNMSVIMVSHKEKIQDFFDAEYGMRDGALQKGSRDGFKDLLEREFSR